MPIANPPRRKVRSIYGVFFSTFWVNTVDGSEILHHVGFIKPCKQWDKLPTSTGAGFLLSKVCQDSWQKSVFRASCFFHKIKTAAWAYTLENEDFEPSTWINMEV